MTQAYIFDDPLLRADCVAIFEYVLGEVDIGRRFFVLDLFDGTVDVSLEDVHDNRNRMKRRYRSHTEKRERRDAQWR